MTDDLPPLTDEEWNAYQKALEPNYIQMPKDWRPFCFNDYGNGIICYGVSSPKHWSKECENCPFRK